jgi:hypothetical protein
MQPNGLRCASNNFTMNKLLLAALLSVACWATTGDEDPYKDPALNVNARYIVESVDIKGAPRARMRLSDPLQTEIDQVVGQNYDEPMLKRLADRIKDELHVPDVSIEVRKGRMPDRLVVTFEVGQDEKSFDLDVVRFLYHSKQGWTGEGGATIGIHGNKLSFGLVSDGDRLAERYAGIQAGYERAAVGTDRLGLRFRFLSYHQQWNRTTLLAAPAADIYRERMHFIPEATVYIAEPLEWSFGVDFARYRIPQPSPVALAPSGARTESSNAVVSTLRYHQRWDSGNNNEQEINASYGVRSATRVFESDAVYTRQQGEFRYRLQRGNNEMRVGFLAGRIAGRAPMYDRFILGNAETLRGWNKFDLDPLGASNVVHGSIDYTWHSFLIFYDTGAIWTLTEDREQKQSLGVGIREGAFELAVAFPIRTGRANPVFYVGLNF